LNGLNDADIFIRVCISLETLMIALANISSIAASKENAFSVSKIIYN
jgi:hypothetical protein